MKKTTTTKLYLHLHLKTNPHEDSFHHHRHSMHRCQSLSTRIKTSISIKTRPLNIHRWTKMPPIKITTRRDRMRT